MTRSPYRIAFLALALGALLPATACGGDGAIPVGDGSDGPSAGIEPTAAIAPTPMGGGGRIAFASGREGDYEIFAAAPDGLEVARLTHAEPKGKYFPRWSPDGEVLMYWTYTAEPYVSDEYWLKSDGTGGLFANSVQPYVSFSPDGQTVLMCAAVDGDDLEIITVPLEGGDFTALTANSDKDFMPAWSPDGKTIAFVTDRDGPLHIYLMDADGGNARRLTENDLLEAAPAWSPDGSRIAFFAGQDANASNVYVANADGTGTVNLTGQESGFNEDPTWSPDGQMIAFWSDRSGDHEIYAMRLDGSGLVNISNSPGPDENPWWGP